MAKKAETKSNGHHETEEEEYQELLDEMADNGFPVAKAEDIVHDGIGLIHPPEARPTNAALVASVPGSQHLYEKDEKMKGVLLDLMARTNFRSDAEMKYFLDWVEWCEDFGVQYDGPMRYIVALNSINGTARSQYVDVMTTYRAMSRGNKNYYGGGNQSKPRFKEGELS